MPKRPNIPIDLQRRVLMEARHHCLVCTSEAGIDIHHIVPWEKCKRHEFNNLVALCPNCHRRVSRNYIDRKALRKYKQKAAASAQVAETREGVFVRLNPNEATLIKSNGISSLTDNRTLDYTFCFATRFPDLRYVIQTGGDGLVAFRVEMKSTEAVRVVFQSPCPDLVEMRFCH